MYLNICFQRNLALRPTKISLKVEILTRKNFLYLKFSNFKIKNPASYIISYYNLSIIKVIKDFNVENEEMLTSRIPVSSRTPPPDSHYRPGIFASKRCTATSFIYHEESPIQRCCYICVQRTCRATRVGIFNETLN